MSDNTLVATVILAYIVLIGIGTVTDESSHEKIMNKIEEKKALIELSKDLEWEHQHRLIKKQIDSLILEIEKR